MIFIVFLLRKWWGFVYFSFCVADSVARRGSAIAWEICSHIIVTVLGLVGGAPGGETPRVATTPPRG